MSPFHSRQWVPTRSAVPSRCSATSMPAWSPLVTVPSSSPAEARGPPARCWPLPRRAGRSTIACASECTHDTVARSAGHSLAGRSTSSTCTASTSTSYLPPPGVPVLVTVHLPPSWYSAEALVPSRPDTWLHGVSVSQHRAFPADAPLLPPIENGVPTRRLSARHAKHAFALCLGRICPEKGFHIAFDAAKTGGVAAAPGGRRVSLRGA